MISSWFHVQYLGALVDTVQAYRGTVDLERRTMEDFFLKKEPSFCSLGFSNMQYGGWDISQSNCLTENFGIFSDALCFFKS